MIDPLRPYWPTNRSLAGLLARSLCLLVAASAVFFGVARSVTLVVVLAAAAVQASILVFEWMELRQAKRSGLVGAAVVGVLLLSLVLALIIESRSVLGLSVR